MLASHGKGNVLQDLKRYEEALVAYEQAIYLDPQLAVAYNGYSRCYEGANKWINLIRKMEQRTLRRTILPGKEDLYCPPFSFAAGFYSSFSSFYLHLHGFLQKIEHRSRQLLLRSFKEDLTMEHQQSLLKIRRQPVFARSLPLRLQVQ